MVRSRDPSPLGKSQEVLQAEGASWSVSCWMHWLTSWPTAVNLTDAQEALSNLNAQMTPRSTIETLHEQCETPPFCQLNVP